MILLGDYLVCEAGVLYTAFFSLSAAAFLCTCAEAQIGVPQSLAIGTRRVIIVQVRSVILCNT